MKRRFTRTLETVAVLLFCLILTGCSSDLVAPANTGRSDELNFGPEQRLGHNEKDLSTPSYAMAPMAGSMPSGLKPMIGPHLKPSKLRPISTTPA